MIHVWAFDPGKMTGWAHLSVNGDDDISLFRCGQGDHKEIGDMLRSNQALTFTTASHPFSAGPTPTDIEAVFVCESFQMTPGKSPQNWSLETTGLIRYWADFYSIPFKLQMPSEAKTLVTDKALKKAELYTPGQPHANDASRHALYYLIKNKRILTSCLVPMNL